MKRYLWIVVAALGTSMLVAGCESLSGLLSFLSPTLVTVSLVNGADFPVDVAILIGDEQDIPEFLLKETGDELDFSVSAGETQTFSRECGELQAIMIEDADLRFIGGVGPDASTEVLRDGDHFSCGSTLTFTFSHSAIITDFDVDFSVQNR